MSYHLPNFGLTVNIYRFSTWGGIPLTGQLPDVISPANLVPFRHRRASGTANILLLLPILTDIRSSESFDYLTMPSVDPDLIFIAGSLAQYFVVQQVEVTALSYPNAHLIASITAGIGLIPSPSGGAVEEASITGIPDGSNQVFHITAPFTEVEMYVNGLRQKQGIGNSFIVSGQDIVFAEPPEAGDTIEAQIQI